MVRLRTIVFGLVAAIGFSPAHAQVPAAAEPGSVPESQPSLSQSVPSPTVATPRHPRLSGGVMAGLKISGEAPAYPSEARARGIQGAVVLHATVGGDGRVESLSVVSGNSLLADAALDAVKTWVYKPYLLNGESTEVETTVTVNFNLGSDATPTQATPPGGAPAGGMLGGTSPSPLPPRGGAYTPGGPVRISAGVMAGQKLSGPEPVYPPDVETSGTVVMRAIVGKDGTVQSLTVVSGPPMLTGPAIDAVKQWSYKPYLLNGDPVDVDTTIAVRFSR